MIFKPPFPANGTTGTSLTNHFFKKLTLSFGLLAAATGVLGIIGNSFRIPAISSVYPGYKTMALSASLVWIFLGLVLAAITLKPPGKRSAMTVQAALIVIAGAEAVELLCVLFGSHFVVESWFVGVGTIFFGTSVFTSLPGSRRTDDTCRGLPGFYGEGSECTSGRPAGP